MTAHDPRSAPQSNPLPGSHTMRFLTPVAVGLFFAFAHQIAAQNLSIPNSGLSDNGAATRESAIDAFTSQIVNVNRTLSINGVQYPFFNGPLATTGSLTQQIQYSESVLLAAMQTSAPTEIAGVMVQMLPNISKAEDYAAFYDAIEGIMPKPMAMDTSDENFGMQRITIKGFNLQRVHLDEDEYLPDDATLTDESVGEICGSNVTLTNILKRKQLFVEDFSDYAQWNDPEQVSTKYVAPVIGYFCYNLDQEKLLPLAIKVIHLNDSENSITYTPFDTPGEWMLAKMALDAIESDYQQIQHLAETHAVTIPIRVELFRHISAQHPISALLMHHIKTDFGLELQTAIQILNSSTVIDLTFGFGATGATRFLDSQLKNVVSIKNDFMHDIHTRGLDHIPNHKFALYGKLHYLNIADFVDEYLRAYYPNKSAVAADFELQNWAQACAQVPHLHDFPENLESYEALSELMTHLIFQSTVKHHAMNGACSWQTTAIPFSSPALWKPMPTAKLQAGESIDPMSYAIPKTLAPKLIGLAATFSRAVPESQSLLSAYQSEPFASESVLSDAIDQFVDSLKEIDSLITDLEDGETWPYELLRPGKLPFYEWI